MNNIIYTVKHELTSKAWWKAASLRAARTSLSALLPFFVAVSIFEVDWVLASSTVALSAIVSYLTSLGGLKELTNGTTDKLMAVAVRGIKTFGQVLVSYIGAATLLHEVDWSAGLAFSLSATVVTLISGAVTHLPETEEHLT